MKKFSLDKFYRNSNFNFCKHFWKFAIAPLVLIVTAMVLLCTVGFNAGFDFTGGYAVTVYSNNESVFANGKSYDLDDGKSYNEFIDVINKALEKNELKASSLQKTYHEDYELYIKDGHAIIVRIQTTDEEKVNAFKGYLVEALEYDEDADAEKSIVVSTVSPTISQYTLNLVIVALISAIAVLFVYLLIRFGLAGAMSVVFGLAHDVLAMLCFALVFRHPVETWFLAGVVVLMMFSFVNNIYMFNNISKNASNGKFEENGKYSRANNPEVANLSIKETLSRQTVFVCVTLITLSLAAIVATGAVRRAIFPFLLGVCASIYANIFILPALWSISYVPPKKKKVKEEKKKDEYVV